MASAYSAGHRMAAASIAASNAAIAIEPRLDPRRNCRGRRRPPSRSLYPHADGIRRSDHASESAHTASNRPLRQRRSGGGFGPLPIRWRADSRAPRKPKRLRLRQYFVVGRRSPDDLRCSRDRDFHDPPRGGSYGQRFFAQRSHVTRGGVHCRQVPVGVRMNCSYCLGELHPTKAPRCWSCEARHHRDCWYANGGCSQFACPGAPVDAFA